MHVVAWCGSLLGMLAGTSPNDAARWPVILPHPAVPIGTQVVVTVVLLGFAKSTPMVAVLLFANKFANAPVLYICPLPLAHLAPLAPLAVCLCL